MILSYSSSVTSASGCAPRSRDIQHGIDPTERLDGGGEHRLDVGLLRDVTVERHYVLAELVRRLSLPAADISGEDLGAFPHEDLGRRLAIPDPAPVMTATFPSSSPIRSSPDVLSP